MRAFIVKTPNRPGALADLADAIGNRGINITGVAGSTWQDSGAITIITNDDAGTRSVLDASGSEIRELELVAASLEDKPGTLGDAARKLSDAGINIEAILPTGMSGGKVTVAFAVEDAAAAKQALGDLVAAGATAL
jgi:hypothetical protein